MRRTAATGTLRGDLTVALDGLGGCLSRLRLEGRSTGVGWRSGARNGSQVAMGGPQEPSDRSGRLTADGVISDAGLAASPARTAPHTSEGGHGYVSLLGPAARRAGVDLSTPGWTRFAHSLAPEDRLPLMRRGFSPDLGRPRTVPDISSRFCGIRAVLGVDWTALSMVWVHPFQSMWSAVASGLLSGMLLRRPRLLRDTSKTVYSALVFTFTRPLRMCSPHSPPRDPTNFFPPPRLRPASRAAHHEAAAA